MFWLGMSGVLSSDTDGQLMVLFKLHCSAVVQALQISLYCLQLSLNQRTFAVQSFKKPSKQAISISLPRGQSRASAFVRAHESPININIIIRQVNSARCSLPVLLSQ